MTAITRGEFVNLISLIFSAYTDYYLEEVRPLLEDRLGPVDYVSAELPFGVFTSFYDSEMGPGLTARLVSFRRLFHPSELPEIKLLTRGIEDAMRVSGDRKVNIDPGYVHHTQFVLASTKHWANRMYVGRGIFAEITLMFVNGAFRPFEHTYPNYKSKEYIDELTRIRNIYLEKRKEKLR
jgi:hypothetical protein